MVGSAALFHQAAAGWAYVLSEDGGSAEQLYLPQVRRQGDLLGDEKLAVSIGEGALDGLTGEATLAINISASPFYLGKPEMRRRMMEETWEKSRIPLLFVNQVGGQGETVFDGGSMFCDKAGRVAVLPVFEDGHVLIDTAAPAPPSAELPSSEAAWIYAALKRGFVDYLKAANQSRVIIGLSGGIDSAVVCALAADALGPENVRGLIMPGPYSSPGSITDAKALAENLRWSIRAAHHFLYESYLDTLERSWPTGLLT